MNEILCKVERLTFKPTRRLPGRFRRSAGRVLAMAVLGLLSQPWSATDVHAEPAAYWRWRSSTDGQEFCTQTPPGPGWTQVAGPFRDLQCREPGSVPLRRWAEPPQKRF